MAAVLVDSMSALSLKETVEVPDLLDIEFKIAGLKNFSLSLEAGTAIRDIKKLAKEECDMEPEHMRFIHKDRELKDADLFESEMASSPIQIIYTAKNEALMGGGCKARSGCHTGQPGQLLRGQTTASLNPYSTPVRGIPGSKGLRESRMSGRRGGMGLIRKYGIMMKRQEFREKAEEIGFRKYR